MSKKTNDGAKSKDSTKDADHALSQTLTDQANGFTTVKKGSKQASANFCKTSADFGIHALHFIRLGNFPLAIQFLSRAIEEDPTDTRHYLNRSYCYLRTGYYASALEDIKLGSNYFTDITERAMAKRREGQAFGGLQNYRAAEEAFRKCLELVPDCPYAKRELTRIQVAQLVGMGFNERSAILALKNNPDTTEVIVQLANEMTSDNEPYDCAESASDDELYNSDEEIHGSNQKLLTRITNCVPRILHQPLMPEQTATQTKPPGIQQARTASTDRGLRVIKTITPSAKPNSAINEFAVWVGYITPQITDSMLTKRFGKFGKVSGIYRPLNASYCFINFSIVGPAKKALEEATFNGGKLDVDGHVLPINSCNLKTVK